MEVGQLYQFVLTVVLVGLILGIGVLVLGKLGDSSSITATANTTLQDTVTALTPIASTWLPLVVTVAVLAIILTLVLRAFGGGAR